MDEDLVIQVMDKLSAATFAPHETILKQGKADDKVAIVVEGEASLNQDGRAACAKLNALLNSRIIFNQ